MALAPSVPIPAAESGHAASAANIKRLVYKVKVEFVQKTID